jgi:hypothetical protein
MNTKIPSALNSENCQRPISRIAELEHLNSNLRRDNILARQQAAELIDLLHQCLHTGALRTDSTRQLYLDVCRAIGEEPK